ncbi:hypothetical protein FALCPG4_009755 [Fusarium falciforme]
MTMSRTLRRRPGDTYSSMRQGILVSSLPRLTNRLVTMYARMPSRALAPSMVNCTKDRRNPRILAPYALVFLICIQQLSRPTARSRSEDKVLQATIVLHLPGPVEMRVQAHA